MTTITSRQAVDRWKYRSRLEIVTDILQQCQEPGANITTIIRECSLSYARAKMLLEQLIERDLVKQKPSHPNLYVVTER
jgi:predicted transcriptional regulator